MKLYVGNVPYAATEKDLEEHFETYGPLISVEIIRDQYDGRSKGHGFVEVENQEVGKKAINELNGTELMGRSLKVEPARPHGQAKGGQQHSDQGKTSHQQSNITSASDRKFHNPYTFVPTPSRDNITDKPFAGDFNPLEHPSGQEHNLDHASLKPNLWTGHIPIKLTTATPLVLLKGDGEERPTDTHQTYDVLDYLPETSLRGMLRSAYEVVTNSRYSCFGSEHKEKLAYRMDSRDSPQLIPAIIKNGSKPGELVAQLCTGTSVPTVDGPKKGGTFQEGAVYAAMLTLYDNNGLQTECDSGYTPITGDEVWAEIVLCQHEVSPRDRDHWSNDFLFWKVIKVWEKKKHPTQPAETEKKLWYLSKPNTTHRRQSYYAPINPIDRRIVEGCVMITNENIKDKHDERIFFFDPPTGPTLTLSDKDVTDLQNDWKKLIKNYRDARTEKELFDRQNAKNQPWKSTGNDPGETAWSPHLYQDSKHRSIWHNNDPHGRTSKHDPHGRTSKHDAIELKQGDLVYAKYDFNSGKITHLLPVSISRVLYDATPQDLLPHSLRPAKRRSELSPADRLFGWVAQPDDEGSDQEDQGQELDPYKGRIRVVCDDRPRPHIIEQFDDNQTLPLTILGQPKPEQARFYVAKDDKGTRQKDRLSKKEAGYSKGKSLRGRKQYWHHKGLETHKQATKPARDYWKATVEDRTKIERNGRYQEYRRPDKCPDEQNPKGWQQKDSQNRSITGWIKPGKEFRASLYVQNLQDEEIGALLWLLSLNKLYAENYYFRLGYGKPLGFGSVKMEIDCQDELPLGKGKDWKDYYASFNKSAPEKLGEPQRSDCINKFKTSMKKAYDKQLGVQNFDKLPFIKELLQVLKGPEDNLPIHYPRTDPVQDPEGKNFAWFSRNESNRNSRLVLPTATGDKGIPYNP